jgi:hypothetical protein
MQFTGHNYACSLLQFENVPNSNTQLIQHICWLSTHKQSSTQTSELFFSVAPPCFYTCPRHLHLPKCDPHLLNSEKCCALLTFPFYGPRCRHCLHTKTQDKHRFILLISLCLRSEFKVYCLCLKKLFHIFCIPSQLVV